LRLGSDGAPDAADLVRIENAIAEAAARAEIVLAITTITSSKTAGGAHRSGSKISCIIASMPEPRSMSATARRACTASKSIATDRSFTISATSS
jgi:hypothetical protein